MAIAASIPLHLRQFRWKLGLFLAVVAWHLLFVFLPWKELLSVSPLKLPKKVEVAPMDPADVSKIRRQWRRRKFVIQPRGNEAQEAPDNARFQSERNSRVEREQRAARTTALPSFPQARSKGKESTPTRSQPLPNLGTLGVRYKLTDKRKAPPKTRIWRKAQPGVAGDQELLEDHLPTGAENLLNTARAKYYSFYLRIYEKLAPLWNLAVGSLSTRTIPNLQPKIYQAVVEVVTDRAGRITEINFRHSTGIPQFDAAVEQTLRQARELTHPPSGLLKPNPRTGQLEYRDEFSFAIRLDQRRTFYTTSPLRN